MALQKTPIPINFARGLDQKTDPLQVQVGNFLRLNNTVFDSVGRLTKRNGYGSLPTPPSAASYLTTFNGNLTAIDNSLQAYAAGSGSWVNKGHIQPAQVEVLPLIRSNTNQSQSDTAVASNGFVCTVFTDNLPDGSGGTTASYKYAIADSNSGQNIVAPTVIPVPAGSVAGAPRVFLLGTHFVIVITVNITGTYHLQYIAIPVNNPTLPGTAVNLTSSYTPAATLAFDGAVANNSLYLAWNGSDGGGAIRMTYLDSSLVQHSTKVFAGRVATIMSVCADVTGNTPVIWVNFYDLPSTSGYALAVNQQLGTVLAPTQTISSGTILNVTAAAKNMVCTLLYEVQNKYGYDNTIQTDFIRKNTITQAGVVGSSSVLLRSVGLASKAFIINSVIYMLSVYAGALQPTYFLIDSSGNVITKQAYSNGPGSASLLLSNVTVTGNVAQYSYLIKDLISPIVKPFTTAAGTTFTAGVYSQTGVNLSTTTITTANLNVVEIGQDLHLSGGFMWAYDGFAPVEDGFHLWPESLKVTNAATAGSITTQQYFYAATYEWSDNQGNNYRSAPSVAVSITPLNNNSTNTIYIPTLRLTYKTANPVKIVLYRWSANQQTFFQVTSVASPVLNDTTVDYVTIVDDASVASIGGNSILYTTGGVVENIAPPPTSAIALYKSRLVLIDSEDRNLLWYSKQVIEATPVEMSDLFTIYVAPTTGAQGSTGPMKALGAMDDKLIIFKRDALYYITGTGPDNTGANNDFSEPVYINSTVGSSNQKSIVLIPSGLMFQSDKGIWLLGRDLSTEYIGAPVEGYTQAGTVQSAVNVPGTNQVRFTLDSGVTLMYDYYVKQWGVFTGSPAVSSCIYNHLHTTINAQGLVFQETPGAYLDGASPVLLSFSTGWINVAGLQGFQRAYFMYLLGKYISPHKINVQIAYDYNPAPSQSTIITPDNYSPTYGDSLYGNGSPYGGPSATEQNRVFFQRGKCESFQVIVDELYDPALGVGAGAGFTLSGLLLIAGGKKAYPTLKASRSFG